METKEIYECSAWYVEYLVNFMRSCIKPVFVVQRDRMESEGTK